MLPEEILNNIADESIQGGEIIDAIQCLSPRHAACISLRYIAGLSCQDTAAQLGISTATVSREVKTAIGEIKRIICR